MNKNSTKLSTLPLAMLSIAAIFSLRNLPIAAMYGFSLVTYYLLAILLFFIPTAYICSHLATHYPEAGGLYAWVRKALGRKFGFLAIWLEWINTVVAFPSMIGFILFTLIYSFAPQVANDKWFEFSFMLCVFWGLTFLNLLGIHTSSWFSTLGVIFGTLLIALLLIALAAWWLIHGHPSQLHIHTHTLIPHLQMSTLAFLITVINSVSGIQIMAFHIRETHQPQKTFPRAIALSACVILSLSILASLAIATVMPHQNPSLIGGIVQSLQQFLAPIHLSRLVPILCALIAIGIIAEINSWMIGPSKGIHAAAVQGDIPQALAKTNRHHVPHRVLYMQAIVGSALGSYYILMPNVNSAYWLLSDLTAQFTMMMWVLVFISSIVLAYRSKSSNRKLIRTLAITGAFTCLFVLAMSFIPPTSVIHHSHITRYESLMVGGILFFLLLPRFLLAKKVL